MGSFLLLLMGRGSPSEIFTLSWVKAMALDNREEKHRLSIYFRLGIRLQWQHQPCASEAF